MLYFVPGFKVTVADGQKIYPISKDMFNPDIYVLDQKIIKKAFPNASIEFIKESIINNSLSPLTLFPSKYIKESEIITTIDPLVEYSVFSRIGTGAKPISHTTLVLKELYNNINEILVTGYKTIVRQGFQMQQNITNKSISANDDEILICLISLKLSINNDMIITLSSEGDETLYDSIIKSLIYFDTKKTKVNLGFKIKIGFLNVKDESFENIISFKNIDFPLDVSKRNNIRFLQYPEDQFVANLIDAGISKNSLKILKQITANRKKIKMKG